MCVFYDSPENRLHSHHLWKSHIYIYTRKWKANNRLANRSSVEKKNKHPRCVLLCNRLVLSICSQLLGCRRCINVCDEGVSKLQKPIDRPVEWHPHHTANIHVLFLFSSPFFLSFVKQEKDFLLRRFSYREGSVPEPACYRFDRCATQKALCTALRKNTTAHKTSPQSID